MAKFIFVSKVNEKYIRWSQLNVFTSLELRLIIKRIVFWEKPSPIARVLGGDQNPFSNPFSSIFF